MAVRRDEMQLGSLPLRNQVPSVAFNTREGYLKVSVHRGIQLEKSENFAPPYSDMRLPRPPCDRAFSCRQSYFPAAGFVLQR